MNRLALAIVLLPVTAAGCSVVLDPGEVQCETAADCTARGFKDATCQASLCVVAPPPPPPPDPIWGCLGHVQPPNIDPTKKITITEQLVSAVDGTPVTDVVCDVCDKLDINCTGNNPDFPKGLHPDAMGNVTASILQGFDGFVRVSSMNMTWMDSRIFIGQPLVGQPPVKVIQLLKPGDYALIAGIAHQMVDMTKGTAILEGVDCQEVPTHGISFKTNNGDSKTLTFYLVNMLPQEAPMTTSTDAQGYGGFFNMPMGSAVARAYVAKTGVCIGESAFQVLPYTISYVLVAPSPSCS